MEPSLKILERKLDIYVHYAISQWTLFLTRSRLLFYFLFRIRSIYFRNIYRLQMALGV